MKYFITSGSGVGWALMSCAVKLFPYSALEVDSLKAFCYVGRLRW